MAPVAVVPSAVPLAVPALGVMPDENPVWGDAPAPGLLLALEALEFVRLAEPSCDNVVPAPLGPGVLRVLELVLVVSAIAGVTIVATMAIAPYKCDFMFQLQVAHLEKLDKQTPVSTAILVK